MAEDPPLRIIPSQGFADWLRARQSSLVFTTYHANRLFFLSAKPDGRIAALERLVDTPMGLAVTQDRIVVATLWQLWYFENALGHGEHHGDHDRVYVPRRSYTTGAVDVHDVAEDGDGRAVLAVTAFSCLAHPSERYSFRPFWKPRFITALAPEDRCHLNGIAMLEGRPAFVTAVAATDRLQAWREHRRDGGVLVDVASGEIALRGLSMPHSPRFHEGRLWLLNSGTGELGVADTAGGRFEPVAFCPGFARGLAFVDGYAIVGLSRQRLNRTFQGLVLDERLTGAGREATCGLWVVDTRTGLVVHTVTFEGVVSELYDVAVLPGVRRPSALGFRNDEIKRFLTVDDAAGPRFRAYPPPSKSRPD